jgi:hypothetical protein
MGWPNSGESGWIPAKTAGIRPFWPDPAGIWPFWKDFGRSGQISVRWPEYDQFGHWNLGQPDSGDIDLRLSDFGTGKISVIVDCFNVKVDCVV